MRYALIYGTFAGIIIFGLSALVFLSGLLGHIDNPLYGYLIMIVGLTMIFVGVKRYRDVEKGGTIRFGEALAVGLGIALVASLIYVGGFEAYYATAPGSELFDMIVGIEPRYAGILFRWAWGLFEILPADLIVALGSAAILRNPRVLPARAV